MHGAGDVVLSGPSDARRVTAEGRGSRERRGREPGSGDVSDGLAPHGPAHQRRLTIIYVHDDDGGGVKQKATTTAVGRGRRALAAGATRGAI